MHTIYERRTWQQLHQQLGRVRAARVHQVGRSTFAYDIMDVTCPDECEDLMIRITVETVTQCIKTVQQLVGAEIL